MREMKDSGVEWIGEIPGDWQTRKLFGLLSNIGSGTTPKGDDYYIDGTIPWLNTGDLNDQLIERTSKAVTALALEECSALQLHEAGAVVIAMYGATIGKLGITTIDLTTNQACCVMNPSNKLDKKYLFYVLVSAKDYFIFSSYGSGQPNISQNTIRNLKVPFMEIVEQKRIADYLDVKCSKIDSIIAKQEEIIEKLKEYKLSVITEAVTKGLNPAVDMKDSGDEWISDIPKHCSVTRCGRLYRIILGKMLATEPKDDSDTLEKYFCAANVHYEGINKTDLKVMWFSDKEKEQFRVKNNDLLVVEGGAGAGGASIICEIDDDYYVQNSIMIVRSDSEIRNRWLYYTLYMLVKRKYIDFVCNKATIPHFTKEKLGNVPVTIFPEDEMKSIVDFLDDCCERIDKTIKDRENSINKLLEYKKSLIYEVVTCKKEV